MSNLEELIQTTVEDGLREAVSKKIDKITENIVDIILAQPGTREKFTELVNKAITKALEDLNLNQ